MGCTTEFNKWEGITYHSGHRKLYTAISTVSGGMADGGSSGNDKGTANHLKMAVNNCGCVMEMDVDESNMMATRARMLVCGGPYTSGAVDKCATDAISNPDNVAMIHDYNQLIIGEDTGNHQNDLIWIYDFPTGALTRVASTPYGSETTSPYWYTVGDWNYMTFIVQHPYGESDQAQIAEAGATGMGVYARARERNEHASARGSDDAIRLDTKPIVLSYANWERLTSRFVQARQDGLDTSDLFRLLLAR
jgi:hypothetical protein